MKFTAIVSTTLIGLSASMLHAGSTAPTLTPVINSPMPVPGPAPVPSPAVAAFIRGQVSDLLNSSAPPVLTFGTATTLLNLFSQISGNTVLLAQLGLTQAQVEAVMLNLANQIASQ